MKTFLDLVLISMIVCFVIDISGIVNSVKSGIAHFLPYKVNPEDIILKPFDCSLCMTWWTGLFYLIIINKFTILNILIISVLSMLSSTITELMLTFKDILDIILKKIQNYIQ